MPGSLRTDEKLRGLDNKLERNSSSTGINSAGSYQNGSLRGHIEYIVQVLIVEELLP